MNSLNFDFSQIAEFLTKLNLWDKPINKFESHDIEAFCKVAVECCQNLEQAVWKPPYLTEKGELVIPANAPLKYRYWQGGQSPAETAQEFTNDYNIIKRYGHVK